MDKLIESSRAAFDVGADAVIASLRAYVQERERATALEQRVEEEIDRAEFWKNLWKQTITLAEQGGLTASEAVKLRAKVDEAVRKGAEARREQVSVALDAWLDTFEEKVWPGLRPFYGKKGWREKAKALCASARIAVDDRTLDRKLAAAREKGIVPRLRRPRLG